MPVPTEQKLVALTRDIGSRRLLADLLGVDRAQFTRWLHGEEIDDVTAERVDLLDLVMAHLLRLYSLKMARRWLVGLNPGLGDRRPVDLIRRGRSRELFAVLDVIANERSGGFA